MASKSGAFTSSAYKIAGTFGTAASVGAGNKLPYAITPNFNVDELTVQQIGTGVTFEDFTARGNLAPTVSLAGDGGYANGMDYICAQFFGTAAAPAEQTGGQGDYKHVVSWNTTSNAKYGTLVYETSTTTVLEYPSTTTTSISFDASDAPGILQFSAELLAHNVLTTGTANNNAAVVAATSVDTERIAFAFEDTFKINNFSGAALSGAAAQAITAFQLTLNRPQELRGEIKGAVGNSAPVDSDIANGSLSITLKECADHTWFSLWLAETAQKCQLNIQGTQIGTGVNRAITIYIPKMVLVQEPQYAITSPGVNPLTLNFKIIAAAAAPTGMTSVYPYMDIINTRSANLLT